mgnify:CR=1 FL=1
MSAQRGKDILLKIEGAPGVFTTVAGLRARTISLNARTVDATDGDSAGRWRELLGGAGTPMIGKIICHGDTREQALARMRTALSEMVVEGINTNIPLHRELMVDASFVAGGTNIHYLEEWLSQRER